MFYLTGIRPDPGFVSPIRSDPGFVSPIRSDPGFVSLIRSGPIRSGPILVLSTARFSLRGNVSLFKHAREELRCKQHFNNNLRIGQ